MKDLTTLIRLATVVSLLGLAACAGPQQQPPVVAQGEQAQSVDPRQQACLKLVRELRYVCHNGLREYRGRGGSASTNYDCLAARLEFQDKCLP